MLFIEIIFINPFRYRLEFKLRKLYLLVYFYYLLSLKYLKCQKLLNQSTFLNYYYKITCNSWS